MEIFQNLILNPYVLRSTKVIGYITVGSNKIDEAVKFYDELFAELGIGRFMEEDGIFVVWGSADSPGFCVTRPFDENKATVGNGSMAAFVVDSKEKVNSLHQKALSLGATDEGAPGPRGENFYAGYFRDLDGNKLNFFCEA